MAGYGGETPLIGFGLRLTVEAPTGTDSTTPVEQGDIFKLGSTAADGSGYKAVALVAADAASDPVIMVMALHRMTSVGPLGVAVLGNWHQVRRLNYYTGEAPSIGNSIEASNNNVRKVKGKAFDGDGYVLNVDTTALQVEVLV